VKVSNLVPGMSKVCCRFSGIGAFFIASSLNSVLKLSLKDTGIHDFVDFVLFFTFHCNRVRWWEFVKTIVLVRSKTVDVKDSVELQIVWQFQFEVQVANTFNDFEKAELAWAQLRTLLVDLDVLSLEPDEVTNIEGVSCFFVALVLFLHLFF
jgi:hypothetical protein